MSLRCPECAGDLLSVGIHAPCERFATGRPLGVLLVAIPLLVLGFAPTRNAVRGLLPEPTGSIVASRVAYELPGVEGVTIELVTEGPAAQGPTWTVVDPRRNKWFVIEGGAEPATVRDGDPPTAQSGFGGGGGGGGGGQNGVRTLALEHASDSRVLDSGEFHLYRTTLRSRTRAADGRNMSGSGNGYVGELPARDEFVEWLGGVMPDSSIEQRAAVADFVVMGATELDVSNAAPFQRPEQVSPGQAKPTFRQVYPTVFGIPGQWLRPAVDVGLVISAAMILLGLMLLTGGGTSVRRAWHSGGVS